MTRGMLISLALTGGLLLSTHIGNAHAVVAPSLAQVATHSLVEKVGWKYCYWKQKRSGKWKFKCED